MIDIHCHLNFPQFEKDLDEVIKRATDKGVEKIVNVGTSIEESRKVIELSQKYENLYAIVGVHPHDADKLGDNWLKELENLAKKPKVIGIGEIGLDYFQARVGNVDHDVQKEVFKKQIELSIKLKLPLQIHSRKAADNVVDILKSYKNDLLPIPGMFHCMAGDLDYLKNVLDLGFYVGFDGNITYEGLAPGENTMLSGLIKNTPLDKIVTETDSPFLTPIPHRGGRNEPSYVIIVGESIAKIKGTSFEKIKEETSENSKKIFNL
ncbi:MAG TPA: TatD family hydrolase [Candidatus Sulfotelmatobacter sp.]|nr:TatD family hydrolase [Candidatus Sulfotelmatobacter sp.]